VDGYSAPVLDGNAGLLLKSSTACKYLVQVLENCMLLLPRIPTPVDSSESQGTIVDLNGNKNRYE
jgi:hypothetical protein